MAIPPVTEWSPDEVKISWQPINSTDWYGYAEEITGYNVLIEQEDGQFSVSPRCEMSESLEEECTVSIDELTEDPFDLDWGSEVRAKVEVLYQNGNSIETPVGGGGVLITYPKPPTDLIEDPKKRSQSSIGLKWFPPKDTGGCATSELRYRVW
jgi:hypothetical protein